MAEYVEGDDQSSVFLGETAYAEELGHDVYNGAFGTEATLWSTPSDLLPTEMASDFDEPTDAKRIYLKDVYGSLGFEIKPTADQLQQIWENVDPEDRQRRTHIIEALRGHHISSENLPHLPDNTYFTLLWGGDFQDLLEDMQTEDARKNRSSYDPMLDGIFSD
jgi:hypothetical protein